MLRANEIAQRFTAAGHSVSHAPVMEIASVPCAAPADAANYDGLIVTSASAAVCLPADVIRVLASKPCLATGPSTAATLKRLGFDNISHFAGEMGGLLAHLSALVRAGRPRWLYPCGSVLSHTPEAMTAQSGAHIDTLEVYAARDLGPWPTQITDMLAQTPFDWSVFLSARTADLFVRNIHKAGLWSASAPGAAACISARVARAIEPLGFTKVCIAPEKTTSSLVDAMGVTYC